MDFFFVVPTDYEGIVMHQLNGTQESCALDCPTTNEGCIKATCCQNNNKVSRASNFNELSIYFIIYRILFLL
jgi:hypothetical protein